MQASGLSGAVLTSLMYNPQTTTHISVHKNGKRTPDGENRPGLLDER
jgi:hypothetical protein